MVRHLSNFATAFPKKTTIIGVTDYTVDLKTQEVLVTASLPYDDVLARIKKTGKEVCFQLVTFSRRKCKAGAFLPYIAPDLGTIVRS